MVVSDKNPFPTESWLDFIYKSTIDTYEGFDKWVIENRDILYPLYTNGIEWVSQFLKNQARIWYDTQNEIHKTNEPYFNQVARELALRVNKSK